MTSDKDAAEAYAKERFETSPMLRGILVEAFLAGAAHVRSSELVIIGQLQAELAHVRKEAEELVDALKCIANCEYGTEPEAWNLAKEALAKWEAKNE